MAYQKTEIPRRGCRQLVCRDVALFSPLNWGEGSAAARHPWASLPSPFPLGDGLSTLRANNVRPYGAALNTEKAARKIRCSFWCYSIC